VLGEIDADELEEAIKAGMETIKKADGFTNPLTGRTTKRDISSTKIGFPSHRYHELARTITEAVLDVSPREVATGEVETGRSMHTVLEPARDSG